MTIKFAVVMDPIATINFKKDSTLAMLWEAKARGWELYYFEQKDLFLRDGVPYGNAKKLNVFKDAHQWFELVGEECIALAELNVILMRKDPPFNASYIYTTYLLEHAERQGVTVVNKPQSLRDANEKVFTTFFPEVCPPNIVAQSRQTLMQFCDEHGDVVCKPLDSMGGTSIFHLKPNDVNRAVVIDMLTHLGNVPIMVQRFIPEITQGDKRILLVNGKPIPHALARIPSDKDWRGNLAAGATGVVQPLSARDKFICAQVGPMLASRGIYFAGIDVIGDYLTEINVTSPTGIREIDHAASINVSAKLMDCIAALIP